MRFPPGKVPDEIPYEAAMAQQERDRAEQLKAEKEEDDALLKRYLPDYVAGVKARKAGEPRDPAKSSDWLLGYDEGLA